MTRCECWDPHGVQELGRLAELMLDRMLLEIPGQWLNGNSTFAALLLGLLRVSDLSLGPEAEVSSVFGA